MDLHKQAAFVQYVETLASRTFLDNALAALYERQTEDEQAAHSSFHANKRGFDKCDAAAYGKRLTIEEKKSMVIRYAHQILSMFDSGELDMPANFQYSKNGTPLKRRRVVIDDSDEEEEEDAYEEEETSEDEEEDVDHTNMEKHTDMYGLWIGDSLKIPSKSFVQTVHNMRLVNQTNGYWDPVKVGDRIREIMERRGSKRIITQDDIDAILYQKMEPVKLTNESSGFYRVYNDKDQEWYSIILTMVQCYSDDFVDVQGYSIHNSEQLIKLLNPTLIYRIDV